RIIREFWPSRGSGSRCGPLESPCACRGQAVLETVEGVPTVDHDASSMRLPQALGKVRTPRGANRF
ncbi:MAG: hypothetical protein ABI082_14850, partial [Dokdonella sp.]